MLVQFLTHKINASILYPVENYSIAYSILKFLFHRYADLGLRIFQIIKKSVRAFVNVMRYGARKQGANYGSNRRNRGNRAFIVKKTRKKEILGLPFSKDIEVTECSHLPNEFTEEKGASVGINANKGIVGIGGSLSNNRKSKMKFTERTTKKSTNKKRAYV